ncbi:MAG: hypothetical protein ACO36A_02980 [Ilumatobacteraceae bacterium]
MRFRAVREFDRRWNNPEPFVFTRAHVIVCAVAAAVAGVVSASVAFRQMAPTIHPDEWGFLLNGRVLFGHDEAVIPTGSFYPAGFGLVTGLLGEVTGTLSGAYRGTLIVNVVLCVLVALAAHRVARRVFGLDARPALIAALLAYVVPGTLVTALFAWAETAARLAFLVFVLAFHRVVHTRSAAGLCGLGLYVGLMPALHGRYTLFLPLVGAVFLWWAWHRDAARIAAAAACGFMVLGYAGSYVLNRYVKTRLYLESYDQENRLLRRLINPTVWPALLRTMVGQSWYLVATMAGFLLVGGVWGVSVVRSRGGLRTLRTDPVRLTAAVMLGCTALLVFTGGLQLLYGYRGDHLIYGRYVEILVPALIVMSVAGAALNPLLARRAWLTGAVATAVVAVVYVIVDWGDGVKGGWIRNEIVFPNIVGTDAVRYLVQPGLLTFAAVFSALGLALWWTSRRSGALAMASLLALLAVGSGWSAERSVLPRTLRHQQSGETVAALRDAGTALLGFDTGQRNDRAYYYLRWKLFPVRLVRFDISAPGSSIPAEYSCVYGFGDRPPADGEWRIVAEEKVLERVLWQRAGSDRC